MKEMEGVEEMKGVEEMEGVEKVGEGGGDEGASRGHDHVDRRENASK